MLSTLLSLTHTYEDVESSSPKYELGGFGDAFAWTPRTHAAPALASPGTFCASGTSRHWCPYMEKSS